MVDAVTVWNLQGELSCVFSPPKLVCVAVTELTTTSPKTLPLSST